MHAYRGLYNKISPQDGRQPAPVFRGAYTARAVCRTGIIVSAITTTQLWIGLGWVTLIGVGGLALALVNHRGHTKATRESDRRNPPKS